MKRKGSRTEALTAVPADAAPAAAAAPVVASFSDEVATVTGASDASAILRTADGFTFSKRAPRRTAPVAAAALDYEALTAQQHQHQQQPAQKRARTTPAPASARRTGRTPAERRVPHAAESAAAAADAAFASSGTLPPAAAAAATADGDISMPSTAAVSASAVALSPAAAAAAPASAPAVDAEVQLAPPAAGHSAAAAAPSPAPAAAPASAPAPPRALEVPVAVLEVPAHVAAGALPDEARLESLLELAVAAHVQACVSAGALEAQTSADTAVLLQGVRDLEQAFIGRARALIAAKTVARVRQQHEAAAAQAEAALSASRQRVTALRAQEARLRIAADAMQREEAAWNGAMATSHAVEASPDAAAAAAACDWAEGAVAAGVTTAFASELRHATGKAAEHFAAQALRVVSAVQRGTEDLRAVKAAEAAVSAGFRSAAFGGYEGLNDSRGLLRRVALGV